MVPLSAKVSVSACATGLTPPVKLPPSQMVASLMPRGFVVERLKTPYRYLKRSPLAYSCAIFSRSSFPLIYKSPFKLGRSSDRRVVAIEGVLRMQFYPRSGDHRACDRLPADQGADYRINSRARHGLPLV